MYFLALILSLVTAVGAVVDPIIIKGNRLFYQTNGTQFFVRGLQYGAGQVLNSEAQIDRIADASSCQRDIEYFTKANINVVRVYFIDPTRDHSACMNALADAGIYVIAGLKDHSNHLDWEDRSWNRATMAQFTGAVDSLAEFSNLLAFSIGTTGGDNDNNSALRAPFLAAAVRDIKKYISGKKYRHIPVGWGTRPSWSDVTGQEAAYMTCKSDAHADFIEPSLRYDRGCTDLALFDKAVEYFKDSKKPIIVQHGCRLETGKDFDPPSFNQVKKLYNTSISESIAGGIVVGYIEHLYYAIQHPGLVSIDERGNVQAGEAFSSLSMALVTLKPSSINMFEYSQPTAVPRCPGPPSSQLNSSVALPPVPNAKLCTCMMDTLQCVSTTAVDGLNFNVFAMCKDSTILDCRETDLEGIQIDSQTGIYGAFSGCNRSEVYSWAVNKISQSGGSCNFNGTAEPRPSPVRSVGECKFLLDQVGVDGEGTLTASFTPTATPDANKSQEGPSETTKSGSLSIGAKAGIGLGACVVAIAVLLGILFLLRRLKQQRKDQSAMSTSAQNPQTNVEEYIGKPEMDGTGSDVHKRRASELPGDEGGVEAQVGLGFLAVNQSPVELPPESLVSGRHSHIVESGER
ncbi:carbohydrate-binding module family 43 protein [Amniculicola lignicola CBS 123094]|uniref:1,3-beta-glucanosyltransferase n=1 Tax=Amniculicola lignicola CBS 123094 TaxID=1392246 RepID=A0A6A5WY28_9PLEO|nr:carbohydrate-binding module family 43 protein [Amniculicola lignicola CBS 123094]